MLASIFPVDLTDAEMRLLSEAANKSTGTFVPTTLSDSLLTVHKQVWLLKKAIGAERRRSAAGRRIVPQDAAPIPLALPAVLPLGRRDEKCSNGAFQVIEAESICESASAGAQPYDPHTEEVHHGGAMHRSQWGRRSIRRYLRSCSREKWQKRKANPSPMRLPSMAPRRGQVEGGAKDGDDRPPGQQLDATGAISMPLSRRSTTSGRKHESTNCRRISLRRKRRRPRHQTASRVFQPCGDRPPTAADAADDDGDTNGGIARAPAASFEWFFLLPFSIQQLASSDTDGGDGASESSEWTGRRQGHGRTEGQSWLCSSD